MYKFLIKIGVNITYDDYKAFRLAAEYGHYTIVQDFIDQKVNINAYDNYAAKMASQNNHSDVLKLLIQHGVPLHTQKHVFLYDAIGNKNLETLVFLMDEYAKYYVSQNIALDNSGTVFRNDWKSILIAVMDNYDFAIFELFMNIGIRIHDDAMQVIVKYGDLSAVKKVVEMGHRLSDYPCAFNTAIRSGKTDIIREFISHRTPITSAHLSYVIRAGRFEIAKMLVNAGASLYSIDRELHEIYSINCDYETHYRPLNKCNMSLQEIRVGDEYYRCPKILHQSSPHIYLKHIIDPTGDYNCRICRTPLEKKVYKN